jgi:hypothetical protein
MEETSQLTPHIDLPTPQETLTPQVPPPTAPPSKPKLPLMGIITIAMVIIALVIGGVIFSQASKPKPASQVPTTPTPVPTRVPNRHLSAIASESAFLALDADVVALSTRVQTLKIQDTTLNPPSLELQLGFSN